MDASRFSEGLRWGGGLAILLLAAALWAGLTAPPAPRPGDDAALAGAEAVADWLAGEDRGHRATENAWQRRASSPPLTTLLHGAGAWALGGTLGDARAVAAVNLLAGLLSLLLVARLLRRRFGPGPALVGALLLALCPGFVESMQDQGPEALHALGLVALAAAVHAATRGPLGAALAALALALNVGLHPTGALLVVPVLVYLVLRHRPERPSPEAGSLALPPLPLYPFAGPLLGLALLVALWPWLDVQTGKRLAEYLFTGYTSEHPDFLWMGTLYVQSKASAPPLWAAPLLTLIRLPIALVALSALGLTALARDRDLLLPALLLACLLAVHALNGSPFYDGNDGLRPLLPLVALLGGAGFAQLADLLGGTRLAGRWGRLALAALVLMAAGLARLEAGDAARSYYNGLVGGRAGAQALEIQLDPWQAPATEPAARKE